MKDERLGYFLAARVQMRLKDFRWKNETVATSRKFPFSIRGYHAKYSITLRNGRRGTKFLWKKSMSLVLARSAGTTLVVAPGTLQGYLGFRHLWSPQDTSEYCFTDRLCPLQGVRDVWFRAEGCHGTKREKDTPGLNAAIV